jgi:C4-dicarboxylate-specific signal transduction histidine kinase
MADYRALAEQDIVGRCVVRDAAFVYVNARFAALTGFDGEALVGRDPHDVFVVETVRSDGDGAADGGDPDDVHTFLDGRHPPPDAEHSHRVTVRRADRSPLETTARFARIEYQGDPATLVVVVPPASVRTDTGSVLERATADLVRAADRDDVCAVAVEAASDVLGFEAVAAYALDQSDTLSAVTSTGSTVTLPPTLPTEGAVWMAFLSDTSRVVSGEACGLDPAVDLLVAPLGDAELLVAASAATRPLDAAVELVDLLATNVEAALDRVRREKRLERLHEATRDLMSAETETDIAAVAIDTATDVLHHDICGVHLYDADRDVLVPVAASERTRTFLGTDGELPAFERGGSLAFDVFETGETHVYDHVNEAPGVMDPETQLRSELIVPIGDRGVFLAGSVLPAHFDETDVSLANVLCANVEAALDRADREAAFRDQQVELEERNDRLDEFASVVSHDLRNPLNVAQGRLELAREECDSDHLDAVAESHDRMVELIDDLLTLARQGRGLGATEPVDLTELVLTCRQAFDGLDVDVVDRLTVDADRSRLRELVENLLRNAAEHAGPDPTVRVGALGAPDDPTGFYVEDDGPGVPESDREEVFEQGYSTDPEGTGFGLAIVRAVADAHGWDVRLTDGGDGGARFEFSF